MGAEAAHALPRPYTSMHSRLKAILVMLKLVYDAINLRPRVEHEYSSSRMDGPYCYQSKPIKAVSVAIPVGYH